MCQKCNRMSVGCQCVLVYEGRSVIDTAAANPRGTGTCVVRERSLLVEGGPRATCSGGTRCRSGAVVTGWGPAMVLVLCCGADYELVDVDGGWLADGEADGFGDRGGGYGEFVGGSACR